MKASCDNKLSWWVGALWFIVYYFFSGKVCLITFHWNDGFACKITHFCLYIFSPSKFLKQKGILIWQTLFWICLRTPIAASSIKIYVSTIKGIPHTRWGKNWLVSVYLQMCNDLPNKHHEWKIPSRYFGAHFCREPWSQRHTVLKALNAVWTSTLPFRTIMEPPMMKIKYICEVMKTGCFGLS